MHPSPCLHCVHAPLGATAQTASPCPPSLGRQYPPPRARAAPRRWVGHLRPRPQGHTAGSRGRPAWSRPPTVGATATHAPRGAARGAHPSSSPRSQVVPGLPDVAARTHGARPDEDSNAVAPAALGERRCPHGRRGCWPWAGQEPRRPREAREHPPAPRPPGCQGGSSFLLRAPVRALLQGHALSSGPCPGAARRPRAGPVTTGLRPQATAAGWPPTAEGFVPPPAAYLCLWPARPWRARATPRAVQRSPRQTPRQSVNAYTRAMAGTEDTVPHHAWARAPYVGECVRGPLVSTEGAGRAGSIQKATGAWRKSPYSLENAITRSNRDFPLAKLARQLRCRSPTASGWRPSAEQFEATVRSSIGRARPDCPVETARLKSRGVICRGGGV